MNERLLQMRDLYEMR